MERKRFNVFPVLALFPLLMLFIVFTYTEKANAANIPNANATGSNYSPYNVDASIKNLSLTSSIKGDKSLGYSSKKKLVYDVFSGLTSNSNKTGLKIETKTFPNQPSQKYVTFTGWSAQVGYRHHTKTNQATYIRAINKQTKEQKTYLLQQTNLSATEDLEYNKAASTPTTIWNACGENVRDKPATTCNMRYEWVGFKAYIPLQDLFPTGTNSGEWELRLIKRVGDSSSNRILWDDLRIPFDYQQVAYNNGKVHISSGVDNDKLVMLEEIAYRRVSPELNAAYRTNGSPYFTLGKTYTRKAQSEVNTSVWYGVQDGKNISWTSSSYWMFGGDVALLSYYKDKKTCPDGSTKYVDQNCTVKITLLHQDVNTGQTIKTDTKTATVGETNKIYSPYASGVLKDKNGRNYAPYPSVTEQQKTINKVSEQNYTFVFKYRVVQADPTTIKEVANGTSTGKAKGSFKWYLEKEKDDKNSRLHLTNNAEITGTHFATRNLKYTIVSPSINQSANKPLELFVNDVKAIEGQDLTYTFEYEFTNHYKETYQCIEKIGNDCFQWQFKENVPIWDSGYIRKGKFETKLKVDTSYGNTIHLKENENELKLVVGRTADFNGLQSANMTKTEQKETLKFPVNRYISLLSQNWFNINEQIQYTSDLKNKLYFNSKQAFYYPNDLDESLREKYKNKTGFELGKYAIPLRIVEQKNDSITFKTKDNFFVTKRTGFQFSAPYDASDVAIEDYAAIDYEKFTGQPYDDSVMKVEGSRYYFNVELKGEEKANTWYSHEFLYSQLGLSDITVQLTKFVEFGKYLVGSVTDNVLIASEPDSIDYDISYPNSVIITVQQQQAIANLGNAKRDTLFSFRKADIPKLKTELQNILPSLYE